MMRIPLKVTYSDGREQAVMVSAPDLIAFERQFDKPTREIGTGRMEYLYWTAWHALKRTGHAGDDFDAWLSGIDSVADDDQTGTDIAPLESSQPTG